MTGHGNHDDTVLDPRHQWAVYRCGHGCFHVALDRILVTLTEDEFSALHDLMRRASEHFHVGAPAAGAPAVRPH